MRKKIVAGNWKMNKTLQEGLELISEAVQMIADEVPSQKVEVVYCPTFVSLYPIGKHLEGKSNQHLGAQNCHHMASGAYTGEVSAQMLSAIGVKFVIIGHSERRSYCGEVDAELAQKVDMALKNNLTPIFCIGETLKEREAGGFFELVAGQISGGLFHLSPEDFKKVVLAYEPVWAIGTGLTATPGQAQEMHAFLRNHVAGKYGEEIANDCTILYGGSCNAQNAESLFTQPDVDGGLIGGASLKSRDFTEIAKALANS